MNKHPDLRVLPQPTYNKNIHLEDRKQPTMSRSKKYIFGFCISVGLTLVAPFGSAQTTVQGDFNGDGYADFAIGSPNKAVDGISAAGKVHIFFGSSNGINITKNQIWHQNSGTIQDTAESGDNFGASLAAGDINGDGFDDLAVGVPGEDLGRKPMLGASILFTAALQD